MMMVALFLKQYYLDTALALLVGYLVDLLVGDPHGMWHPICLIGNLISFFEKRIRKVLPKTERGEFAGGICLVVLVLVCSAGIPFAVLLLGYRIHRGIGFALQCYMCFTILATKSLKTESMKVYHALKNDSLAAGRRAVSMIVGRDTDNLTEVGVTKAAVETIAENASDGVIAPMIFLAIGGPVLGYFYKGVNTMDSMVGYKNEKYMHFGTAAAKMDDVMNYLPSRIAALFLIAACFFLPGITSVKNAARIWKRDRRNHASPNSAQTESVVAGALGVQLAGDAWYFGVKHEKPTIGDALRPVEMEDIVRANRMLYVASIVSIVVCIAICLILARVYFF